MGLKSLIPDLMDMLCLLITLIHNQFWMCIDSNAAYLGYFFFVEVLACIANYSKIYCTLSGCEGAARHVQILYSRKDLKGHQSRMQTICWISQTISKTENMGRKREKTWKGKAGSTQKESQRRPLKGEGFVLDASADSSPCYPHNCYRHLLSIYFLFSSCNIAL